jgi:clan AA aspartic protease (TIGR02281 family)
MPGLSLRRLLACVASTGSAAPLRASSSLRRSSSSARLGWMLVGALCAPLLGAPASAVAEIYRWKDAQGRLHFAQDLNQVPESYRAQAEESARQGGKGREIQHYQTGPAAPSPAGTASGRPPARPGRRIQTGARPIRIEVERAGSAMLVHVRLNDQVVAPFHIDTGATDVVIPQWVASELGLDLAESRTGFYGTANGVVQQALVTLESVDLGGARVENVPATVSPSMSHGLLGLSYFNHFKYHFDPGAGIVTLTPNGLVEAGVLRGGRSEDQWRSQFARLAALRQAIETALDEINPNWTVRRAELEDNLVEADRQRDVLEAEADAAQVPMAWRD